MRTTWRARLILVVGLGLLSLPLLRVAQHRAAAPDHPLPIHLRIAAPGSDPSQRALREAQVWRMQALGRVNRTREALEEEEQTTPALPGGGTINAELLRLQLMARDRDGLLRRARLAARRAERLARSLDETYRAAELLARIEHDAGHHTRELEQARRLMRLKPRNPLSLMILRRAATCTGRHDVADWAAARLQQRGYRSSFP
jgi:hypothetical protein